MNDLDGRRRAFSLLEVMLALALSTVVISIIASGIQMHLRQLTSRRTRMEEAQLARAILRRIADDLRAVAVDRTGDVAANAAMASSAGQDDEAAGEDERSVDEAAAQIVASAVPETPGIYGTNYELQIDVGRVPRYEEYSQLAEFSGGDLEATVSDTKTVSYLFLGAGGALNSSSSTVGSLSLNQLDTLGLPPTQVKLQGVGRREVDRAVARFAIDNGDLSYLDQQVELVAPEVMLLEFRYFDGEQWQMEWNTEEAGGIPLAVEITLVMADPRGLDDSASMASGGVGLTLPADVSYEQVYRLVVHLPAAEMLPTEAESTGDESSAREVSP